ncbi:MAG: hypothetical protein MUO82_10100 [Candidatus Thermoplasmatota archaeon]|nr:hypothetical protein [Candidatus Thermoplasmatota archaeon]
MVEEIELRTSAKELCDVFGLLQDVKNERQLLNIVFFAQNQKMIDKIYSDFKFSDLGPFSPRIDFDLELLKINDILNDTDDPQNTIFLTQKGKRECKQTINKIDKPDLFKKLKGLDVDELLTINRYLFLKDKYDLKEEDYSKLKEIFNIKEEDIIKLKTNIQQIKSIS